MASVRDGAAIVKKQLAQREMYWPGSEPYLWHRKANKGFATIPKTMPLILQIMDDLSNGKPLSSTYLGLWCDTWDNSMVNVSKPEEMAQSAGFSGQRAVYTWQGRMRLLTDLGFIDVKAGRSGAFANILIWNPHRVIRAHHDKKTPGLVEAHFNALLERAVEVGATDMFEPVVVPAPVPITVAPGFVALPPSWTPPAPASPIPPPSPTDIPTVPPLVAPLPSSGIAKARSST